LLSIIESVVWMYEVEDEKAERSSGTVFRLHQALAGFNIVVCVESTGRATRSSSPKGTVCMEGTHRTTNRIRVESRRSCIARRTIYGNTISAKALTAEKLKTAKQQNNGPPSRWKKEKNNSFDTNKITQPPPHQQAAETAAAAAAATGVRRRMRVHMPSLACSVRAKNQSFLRGSLVRVISNE
jgi:hypothetical protein